MAVGRKLRTPVFFDDPSGNKDCINDTYATTHKFESGTLRVYLDSISLLKDIDFEELAGNNGFRILTDQTDRDRLHELPRCNDKMWAHYIRA